PADATLRERMARKLKTKKGRAAYARRKAIVEPAAAKSARILSNQLRIGVTGTRS
ncbi:IS5/IS1182 family transposase, partial [Cryobacterium sp. TMT4-10]